MKIEKIFAGICALLMIFSAVTAPCLPAEATTAGEVTMTITGGGKSVSVGDKVAITVTYTGASFGSFSASVSYPDILEYDSSSSSSPDGQINGGAGVVVASGKTVNPSTSMSFKVGFIAKSPGTANIGVDNDGDIYNNDGSPLNCKKGSTSITVKSAEQLSKNADLGYIEISSGSLSPAFSPSVQTYNIVVENDVKILTITPGKSDTKASVSISGSNALSVGENKRVITVTAEDGVTSKEYVLIVTRKDVPQSSGGTTPQPPPATEPETPTEPEPPAVIETIVGDAAYVVLENYAGVSIPNGFSMDTAKFNEHEIPVIRNVAKNITLGYLQKKDTTEYSWFYYDEEKSAYLAAKELTAAEVAALAESIGGVTIEKPKEEKKAESEDAQEKEKKGYIYVKKNSLIVFIAAFIAIEVTLLAFLFIKVKQMKRVS